jgi:nucleoside-diphosphate-sugar epimerase
VSDRVLVTGGAGYLGSVLVEELVGLGHPVRVLDSLLHGSVPSLVAACRNGGFEFTKGDLRDPLVRASALADVSAVVHLAAVVGDPACARDPDLARAVNLDATRALLEDAAKAGVERFVFASTCSNYGKADSWSLMTEADELRPLSVYAETKVAAERDVLRRTHGSLSTVCLRFATLYGVSPRMRFDLTVNEFTRDTLVRRELVVYGEQFWRPYVHVRDAARAIMTVLEVEEEAVRGEVFNVGATDENYRKLDLVSMLRDRLPGANVRFVRQEEDPRDYRVSFKKIEARLGFSAQVSVADGIGEVIALLESGLIDDPYGPAYRN